MAKRTLEDLQRQYNKLATKKGDRMPAPPRRHGPGGPRAHGKPKDTKATIKRLWSYISCYKLRLFVVLL